MFVVSFRSVNHGFCCGLTLGVHDEEVIKNALCPFQSEF